MNFKNNTTNTNNNCKKENPKIFLLLALIFWICFIVLFVQDIDYLFGSAKNFYKMTESVSPKKDEFVELEVKEVYGCYAYTKHMIGGLIPVGKDSHYIVKLTDDSIVSLAVNKKKDINRLNNLMNNSGVEKFVGRINTPAGKVEQYYVTQLSSTTEEQLGASKIYFNIQIDSTQNKFTVAFLLIGCFAIAGFMTVAFVKTKKQTNVTKNVNNTNDTTSENVKQ